MAHLAPWEILLKLAAPAVYRQIDAIDEGGIFRGEKDGCRGDIFHRRNPA